MAPRGNGKDLKRGTGVRRARARARARADDAVLDGVLWATAVRDFGLGAGRARALALAMGAAARAARTGGMLRAPLDEMGELVARDGPWDPRARARIAGRKPRRRGE